MLRNNHSSGPATGSPRSSGETASRNGSPATKLTAYSPEEARMRSFMDPGNGNGAGPGSAQDVTSRYATTQGIVSDPFTPVSGTGVGMYFSPTASCFTPTGMMHNGAFGGIGRSPGFMPEPPRTGMSYLTATSEPDTPGTGNAHAHQASDFGPIGKAPATSNSPAMFCEVGQFDEDNRNRAFAIEGIPRDFPRVAITEVFDHREFHTLRGPVLTELAPRGIIFVGFTDVREARIGWAKVQKLYPEWRLHAMTAKEFAPKFEHRDLDRVSDFEGHVVATIFYDGRSAEMDGRSISYGFKSLIEPFGDIKAFKTLPTGQDNVIEFLVEFFDTRTAHNVVCTLNGSNLSGCLFELKAYEPDVIERPQYMESPYGTDTTGRTPMSARSGGFSRDSPYVQLSPTGRSMVPIDDSAWALDWNRSNSGPMYRPDRPDFSGGPGGRNERPNGNQNYVDIERIRMGLDVRTTIMLRNIPNKINQVMLKDIVDETSFAKYDFMYLRIDFANNCNVGYAFINFEDPLDIVDFANARAGRPWNCFNSEKVAEISYATIQGKDCLVQKFRNSSVMLEHPSFRPKIFHTGNGPLAGTEERFPTPDNPSKMRRSIENAEHVGLFAPRISQQYRDEQRRRRSQFDRGTISAEREATWLRSGGSHRFPPRFYGHNNMMSPTPNRSWYGSPFNRRV